METQEPSIQTQLTQKQLIEQQLEKVRPAPLPPRIVAFLLDFLLINIVIFLVWIKILFPFFHPGFKEEFVQFWEEQQMNGDSTTFLENYNQQMELYAKYPRAFNDAQFVSIVLFWLYFSMSEIFLRGTTLGKKIFKLQSIDLKTLKKPRGRTILVRNAVKVASICLVFPIFAALNFLVPLFSKHRRAGHDILSQTIVGYETPDLESPETEREPA